MRKPDPMSTRTPDERPAISATLRSISSAPSFKPMVQITRAQADSDNICITIQGDDGTHLRVEIPLKDFADAITSGRKIECVAVRWRLP